MSFALASVDRCCDAPQRAYPCGPLEGYSNFELVYGGHILLLDAYYDRGSVYPSLGFKAADINQEGGRIERAKRWNLT